MDEPNDLPACPLTRRCRFYVPLKHKRLFQDILVIFDSGASLDLISTKVSILKDLRISQGCETQLCGAFGGNTKILGTVILGIIIDNVMKLIKFNVVESNVFDIIIGNPTISVLGLKLENNNVFTRENRILGRKFVYNTTSSMAVNTKTVSEQKHIDDFFKKCRILCESKLSKLKSLFYAYPSAFSKNNDDVSCLPENTFSYKQEFYVNDPPPVKIYKVDQERANIIHAEIEKLLKIGILEISDKNIVTSNLLTVKKPNGETRVVTDLRLVNQYTKPCNLALPDMREIMNLLSGSKVFFQMDVLKAFWSLPVPEHQRQWYTIMSPKTRVIYQYTRMPMGHVHSSVHFQKIIDKIIRDANITNTYTYVDDIVGGFQNDTDLFSELEKLLQSFTQNNLKLSLSKTNVLTDKLKCFGYEISEDGIRPDQNRVNKLLNMHVPTSKKELHSVLASFSYYRTYVRNFAHLSAPLYAMTGKKSEFDMTDDMANKFRILQKALSDHILATPIDHEKGFILETDASILGTGAVLKQSDSNGTEKVVAVDSNSLKGNQRFWSIHHLELLGVYQGLLKFEKIISNKHVLIRVDNSAVFWLLSSKMDQVEVTKRIPASRYLLLISTFNYTVEDVSGVEESFRLADILSRAHERGEKLKLAENSKQPLVTIEKGEVCQAVQTRSKNINEVFEPNKPISEIHEEISMAQVESIECNKLRNKRPKSFVLKNDVIYKSFRNELFIYCPKHYVNEVLKKLHRHESARNLISKITRAKIWIPAKYANVRSFVTNCNICDPARSKRLEQIENVSIPNPTLPFQSIACDITGFGQHIFILVIVDIFTKYIIAKVLPNSNSKSIVNSLIEVFTTFGLPSSILTDNATNFTSAEMDEFLSIFGILHKTSSVFNSRGNAIAEASIKRLQNKLRIYQPNEQELPRFLNVITFLLNTENQSQRMYTPFKSVFHRETSWTRQIPDLSETKKKTFPESMKLMFEEAKKIQDQILNDIAERRAKTSLKTQKIRFMENDLVRIKKLQKVGQRKKTFKPFSEEIFRIIKIDRFTKVCVLREIVNDEIFQPKTLKIHCRFLTKVYEKNDETSDYEPFSVDSNSAQDETDEYSTDVRPETEMSKDKSTNDSPAGSRAKKKELKPSKPSMHKMNLRKR